MLVTNHVLAGRVLGRPLRARPLRAFALGVVSHFAMDACPHWAPKPGAPGSEELFIRIARRDGLAGLAATAFGIAIAPRNARWAVFAAMAGAAVVDADKPCLYFFGFNPFPQWFQRFHEGIQREAPHRLPYDVMIAIALAAFGCVDALANRRSNERSSS